MMMMMMMITPMRPSRQIDTFVRMMMMMVSQLVLVLVVLSFSTVVVDGSRITSNHHHYHPHPHRTGSSSNSNSHHPNRNSSPDHLQRRVTTVSSSGSASGSSTIRTRHSTTAVSLLQSLPLRHRHNSSSSSSNNNNRAAIIRSTTTSTTTIPSPPKVLSSSSVSLFKIPSTPQMLLLMVLSSVLSYTLYEYRTIWLPFFNKEMIQQKVVSILQQIIPTSTHPNNNNNNDIPPFQSLLYYTCGMALWEFFGLSTIPVETAAGMIVPQYPVAVLTSLMGKVVGATIAFLLGRNYLQQSIQQHSMIQSNPIFQILLSNSTSSTGTSTGTGTSNTTSTTSSSFRTALCMKFSCFPELIKNFGSSCISSISIWNFILVTLLHGGFYTMVWTYLGYDTAQHVADPTLSPNQYVPIIVATAMITGCVLTPLVMTWWIRHLQYHAALAKEEQNKSHPLIVHLKSQTIDPLVLRYNILRPQFEAMIAAVQYECQTKMTLLQFVLHTTKYKLQQQVLLVQTIFQLTMNKMIQQVRSSSSTSSTSTSTSSSRIPPTTTTSKATTAPLHQPTTTTTLTSSLRTKTVPVVLTTTNRPSKIITTTAPPTELPPSSTWFMVRFLNSRSLAEIWMILLLVLFLLSS